MDSRAQRYARVRRANTKTRDAWYLHRGRGGYLFSEKAQTFFKKWGWVFFQKPDPWKDLKIKPRA